MLKLTQISLALILVTSISATVAVATADNANFIVQPQKEHVIILHLRETDSISGSLSVVSDDESGIDFYITDPDGNTVLRHSNVKQQSFSFTVQETGDYELHFDNSVSADFGKTVVLNYNIIHYIMGMPQEQFLFLVVAVVALIGILAFALLMPK